MPVLPDLLRRNLKVVFCGSAAGSKSAAVGAYYAGPGNAFWAILHKVGLTPRRLRPGEFRQLADFDIGLTDLWKESSGPDSEVTSTYADVLGLRARVRRHAPRALAFNGKGAAKTFIGRDTDYGRQPETIGETAIFVLPSTSGAARRSWDESKWKDLADWVHWGCS